MTYKQKASPGKRYANMMMILHHYSGYRFIYLAHLNGAFRDALMMRCYHNLNTTT